VAIVTPQELAGFLQQPVDNSSALLVIGLVEEELLEAAAPTLEGDLPAWAKGLVLQAAARSYTNPTGDTEETIDDFRHRLAAASVGGLLTAAERDRVVGIGAGPTGAFTIRPTFRDRVTGLPFVIP